VVLVHSKYVDSNARIIGHHPDPRYSFKLNGWGYKFHFGKGGNEFLQKSRQEMITLCSRNFV
jgi:hypothetical protein